MDTALSISGDLALDSREMPYFVSGTEEVRQRLYIMLSATKGGFIYNRELGSRLSQEEPADNAQAEALAREALSALPDAEVISAVIFDGELTVRIRYEGEELIINVRI